VTFDLETQYDEAQAALADALSIGTVAGRVVESVEYDCATGKHVTMTIHFVEASS
jgi:hypothetical protein